MRRAEYQFIIVSLFSFIKLKFRNYGLQKHRWLNLSLYIEWWPFLYLDNSLTCFCNLNFIHVICGNGLDVIYQILLDLEMRAGNYFEFCPIFLEQVFEHIVNVHILYHKLKHYKTEDNKAKMVMNWIKNIKQMQIVNLSHDLLWYFLVFKCLFILYKCVKIDQIIILLKNGSKRNIFLKYLMINFHRECSGHKCVKLWQSTQIRPLFLVKEFVNVICFWLVYWHVRIICFYCEGLVRLLFFRN